MRESDLKTRDEGGFAARHREYCGMMMGLSHVTFGGGRRIRVRMRAVRGGGHRT